MSSFEIQNDKQVTHYANVRLGGEGDDLHLLRVGLGGHLDGVLGVLVPEEEQCRQNPLFSTLMFLA